MRPLHCWPVRNVSNPHCASFWFSNRATMSQALAFLCWLIFWCCSAQNPIRNRVSASDQFGERPGFIGIADMKESVLLVGGTLGAELRPSEDRLENALRDVGEVTLPWAVVPLSRESISDRKRGCWFDPLLSVPVGDNTDEANWLQRTIRSKTEAKVIIL